MRYKKQIVSIMTLTILLLLMMSTAMQAVSLVGNISDLKASLNGSQMKLTWSSVSGSAGYNVYVNGTKIGSVNSNGASLIGFSENTTYGLRVTAYDYNKIEIATSDEIKFTTTTNQSNLDRVQNLTVTQANGYVTLNWSKVNDADKYQVFVDVPGFGNMNIGEVTTTNAMLKGFSNGMRYGFSIRACKTLNADHVSYGEKSVAQYITIDVNKDDTQNDNNNPTRPDRVTNVTVYDVAETTATVTWKEVNNIDGYEVFLSKNYGSYQSISDKTGNRVALSNLTPNSYYRVKIVAYKWINNKKVYGDESSYSSFTTKQEKIAVGNVGAIYMDSLTANSAKISWSAVSGATGYKIYFAQGNGYFQYMGTTANRSYAFSNLKANSYYQVKIEAYKVVNGKEYTSQMPTVKSFRTESDNATVNNPSISKVTGLKPTMKKTTVALSWNKVDGAAGYEIDFYVPGIGHTLLYANTNYREVSGIIGKDYAYTARVRAYKYINGVKTYGPYSNIVNFREQ